MICEWCGAMAGWYSFRRITDRCGNPALSWWFNDSDICYACLYEQTIGGGE